MTRGKQLAYFLTYTTYGTRLHGDDRPTVDPRHAQYEGEFVVSNRGLARSNQERMRWPPFRLDHGARRVVASAIQGILAFRDWRLYAYHVRSTHVHVVVSAQCPPERILTTLKSWATRRLVEAGLVDRGRRVWTRHGSTRYMWDAASIEAAIDYVLNQQGEPMERWASSLCGRRTGQSGRDRRAEHAP